MPLKPGDAAKDFTLRTVEGQLLSLRSNQQNGYNTLLVFLRHLG